jgi:hypothetical protein
LVVRSTKVKGCMSLSGFERLMELLPSSMGASSNQIDSNRSSER